MTVLKNSRHEAFCLAVVRGESATGAYANVYRATGRTAEVNGSKLLRNTAVGERIIELQGTAAKRTTKTVESLVADLDEIIAFAGQCGNPTAMVAAVNTQAKLLGLMIDRSETTVLHRPAPLPTKVLELSESEWIAQFGKGPGPRLAVTDGAKQRKAEARKLDGSTARRLPAPPITWDIETGEIKARGVIGLDDDD
ncbi:Terminase small subunit [Rhizobium ruizarguesonis]|uniref:Terminase small subunit n=1 Tax=Rhizobium ruizarguesonis TaxID=2081791 RepID=UPI001030A146|nr:Terminase small subunit [Rhizobium ruizarguesonis]TAX75701.1 Terminase small subunit [Rhizobium ruizarguesonis]